MKYKKTTRVKYRVQCDSDAGHIFEKIFKVEEGGGEVESVVEAFCPYCDRLVPAAVKGKARLDEEARRFLQKMGGVIEV